MSLDVFRRLRIELTLWYASVFTALLVALGLITYGHMSSALQHGADDLNHHALADLMECIALQRDGIKVDQAHFVEEAAEAKTLFDVVVIQVFDAAGHAVASNAKQGESLAATGASQETVRFGLRELRLLRHPLMVGERQVGTVVVGHDMRDRMEALSNLSRDLSLMIPLGAVATLLAGLLLAGKALRPIREALERQKRFIADASHELRTPVAVVLAQAEVGQRGNDADARQALQVVQRTAERMGSLVAGLLLLSRADASALALDRRQFYLDDLAEEIVADVRPVAAAQGLDLRFERRDEDVAVLGDPERIQQLVLILIDNAIGHTPLQGEVAVWVERTRTGGVGLGVRDTGSGIPPSDISRVFDRFYRGSRASRGGVGLGLAIAKAIAEAHGGTLNVTSSPGYGSEFRLHLPGAPAPDVP